MPKQWKKVAWNASGPAGSEGAAGTPGQTGESGGNGSSGLPGTSGTVTVKQLEDKIGELLTRVQSLEAILKGIDNQQLQEALAAVPVVAELCGQAKALTAKSGELGTALGGLSTVLGTLTLMALPTIPTALPPFECQ